MATTPSQTFLALNEEWRAIKEGIVHKLDKECKLQKGEQRKATLRRVTAELEEADEIIEQLELETKGKAKLTIQVRSYKSEVKTWRTQVTTLSASSDRDVLFSQPAHTAYDLDIEEDDISSYASPSQSQRSRLLNSTGVLKSSDNRIDNAMRLALESEEVGGNVLGALRGQTSQLEETRDMLGVADGNIAKAGTTIKKMIRQMYKQRIVLVMCLLVLGSLILLILWNKFR